MYICIDVGGTKTLLASFDDDGQIVEQIKIATSHDYNEFLEEVRRSIYGFSTKEYKAAAVGIPTNKFDRTTGVAVRFGNLPWQNVSIGQDISSIANCAVYVENDAKLAGLSEAVLVKDKFKKVLYITVSTGIGISVIDKLKIDTSAGDSGGNSLMVQHDGSYAAWETFASGKAIAERYGKMAKDIEDEETWRNISKDLAVGLISFIAIFQPDVIIVGGSVGRYFDKFGQLLSEAIKSYQIPRVDLPQLMGAQRPEEAGVYGGYELIKQKLNNE